MTTGDIAFSLNEASTDRRPGLDGHGMADVARPLRISRSSVGRLMSFVPCVKAPGVGVRFRRADIGCLFEEHRVQEHFVTAGGPLTHTTAPDAHAALAPEMENTA